MEKFPKYLPAGALLLAILLATMIAVSTGGLLLLLQYHRQYAAQTMRQERLQQNLSSAINLLLANDGNVPEDLQKLNLYDGDDDSVILSLQPWGVFDVATAWAYEGPDTLQYTFLKGKVPTPDERFALYLADEQRPLSLSGQTRIQGDAFLPEAGIRKSYIENEAYAYEEVVHGGSMQVSNATLPEMDGKIIAQLWDYLQPVDSAAWTANAVNWFENSMTDPLTRLFTNDYSILHGPDTVVIDRQTLSGHVIIIADQTMIITANAKLDNVLLFAPCIRFEQGFRGRLQAFARDSLTVGRDCRFDYPSALGLVNIPTDSLFLEFQPIMRIDSASVVNGLVFSHFPGGDQLLAKVVIGKEVVVHGQVYADGLLELQGQVSGMTLCRRFTLQTSSSLYENFILNGVMDITALSPHYVGSPLLLKGRLGRVALSVDTGEPWRDDVN